MVDALNSLPNWVVGAKHTSTSKWRLDAQWRNRKSIIFMYYCRVLEVM